MWLPDFSFCKTIENPRGATLLHPSVSHSGPLEGYFLFLTFLIKHIALWFKSDYIR